MKSFDAEYIVKDTISDIERINGYIAEINAQTGATGYSDQILALETEVLSLQRTVADGYRADMRKLEQERSIASDSYRRTADALALPTLNAGSNATKKSFWRRKLPATRCEPIIGRNTSADLRRQKQMASAQPVSSRSRRIL